MEGAVIHAVVLNRQGIGGLSNIVHIIGRVGDAQVHLDTAGQQIHIRFIGAVPTKQPVVAKLPKMAALAAGRGGGLRCRYGFAVVEVLRVEEIHIKTKQSHVHGGDVLELLLQNFHVEAGVHGQLIVYMNIGPLLIVG